MRYSSRMARWLVGVALATLIGCSGGGDEKVSASVSVPITTSNGTGASYLAKYLGQTIELQIDFADYRVGLSESPGCGETVVYTAEATRTASGPTGPDFAREVLDPIPGWELSLEVCDSAASSSVVLVGAIDAINTSFGCNGIPDALQHRDADGHPQLQSFTATRCNAIILDVDPAFSIGNPDFSMTISTGSVIP